MTTVLVVDDDDLLCECIGEILRAADYRVFKASNGKLALKLLSEERVDLTITDIIMPEMDGFELLAHLRRTAPDMKIIAMSAGASGSASFYLDLASRYENVALLEKPVSAESLMASVSKVLN